MAAAYLAQWMLPVAAQWFLLEQPDQEPFVPFVQVALTLPIALLAIPVGVIADRVDRRRLVLGVQVGVLCVEVVMVWLSETGGLNPWVLLALLAALACGIAGTYTPLSAMVPDLVRREAIPEASALLTIATNSTRVIGPAVAGLIITLNGVNTAFAATIPATLLLVCVLLRMPSPVERPPSYERWLAAAWSGIRFGRHSPQVVKLLLRNFWFTTGIMGLLSLLPVVATQHHANSAQLGGVLAAQGLGAVLGAMTLSRLNSRIHPNGVVGAGFIVGAFAVVLAVFSSNLPELGGAVMLAGWAWTTSLATVQGEMQLYLPAWVRARGLSLLVVATFAGQASGAALSGWIVNAFSVHAALVVAAIILFAGGAQGAILPLKDLRHLDRSAVHGWTGPEMVVPTGEQDRRLQVRLRYEIPQSARGDYLSTMVSLRRIRLRSGARKWQLLECSDQPGVFYEEYLEPSGHEHAEHLRSRSIASDLEVAARVEAMSLSPVSVEYAFRVEFSRLT